MRSAGLGGDLKEFRGLGVGYVRSVVLRIDPHGPELGKTCRGIDDHLFHRAVGGSSAQATPRCEPNVAARIHSDPEVHAPRTTCRVRGRAYLDLLPAASVFVDLRHAASARGGSTAKPRHPDVFVAVEVDAIGVVESAPDLLGPIERTRRTRVDESDHKGRCESLGSLHRFLLPRTSARFRTIWTELRLKGLDTSEEEERAIEAFLLRSCCQTGTVEEIP